MSIMKNIYKCDGAMSWLLPKEEIKCDNLMYLRDIYNNIDFLYKIYNNIGYMNGFLQIVV
jgi:hypothetical protein